MKASIPSPSHRVMCHWQKLAKGGSCPYSTMRQRHTNARPRPQPKQPESVRPPPATRCRIVVTGFILPRSGTATANAGEAYFIRPTMITDTAPMETIPQEVIFGPVL